MGFVNADGYIGADGELAQLPSGELGLGRRSGSIHMSALPKPVIAGMKKIVFSVLRAEGFAKAELPKKLMEPGQHGGMWHGTVRSRLYAGVLLGQHVAALKANRAPESGQPAIPCFERKETVTAAMFQADAFVDLAEVDDALAGGELGLVDFGELRTFAGRRGLPGESSFASCASGPIILIIIGITRFTSFFLYLGFSVFFFFWGCFCFFFGVSWVKSHKMIK